jgi:hypothetical protein
MTEAQRTSRTRSYAAEWLRVTEAAAIARKSYGQMLRLALIGEVVSRRTAAGRLEILASSVKSSS